MIPDQRSRTKNGGKKQDAGKDERAPPPKSEQSRPATPTGSIPNTRPMAKA